MGREIAIQCEEPVVKFKPGMSGHRMMRKIMHQELLDALPRTKIPDKNIDDQMTMTSLDLSSLRRLVDIE